MIVYETIQSDPESVISLGLFFKEMDALKLMHYAASKHNKEKTELFKNDFESTVLSNITVKYNKEKNMYESPIYYFLVTTRIII